MKKNILLTLLYIPFIVFGQSHSWDGKGINSKENLHYLNIFVNIIYDVHPDTNNTFNNPDLYWPTITDPSLEGINTASTPTYLLDWMDTVYVPGHLHGTCTRLYGESSFDSLQVTGDFVVVNIKESTILSHGLFKYYTIRDVAMGMLSQSSSFTLYGHHNLTDFNAKNVLIRNITKNYGGLNPGSGYGGRNTLQCVGDGDLSTNPTCIVSHEISHGLFGDNGFHTSGGNHRYPDNTVMSFLNLQGGYGLMGAANSGLVCCNGYERWRMHWKHSQSVDFISARDSANIQSVVSDISREDGAKIFILRDFVTFGDVIRIKLPYKDSETSSNQYIWLENHQVGSNGKLDFFQFSNTSPCRPQGTAGIYAYYQVGRDQLEGSNNQVWDGYHRDNLKIIPAEGYYDYELRADTHNLECVTYEIHNYSMVRGEENPFCGGQDQEAHLFPQPTDTMLYTTQEYYMWRKIINGQNDNLLPSIGDTLDAFSTYTKISMGTNPSTNNAKTYHSNNANPSTVISAQLPEKNVQTTYLTGLSIEMIPIQGTGNILVKIRWDDYDITNDTRWTGKIALKDTAILTTGNTITLAQNRTVAQPKRDPETGLFAGRTRWTCENGSYFRQDSASVLRLTENSSVVFNSGSHYELSKGARLEIKAGCTFSVQQGANIQLKGTVEVDSGGVLVLYDTAKMGDLASFIVRPGGKLVVDGGTLTNACDGEMWQGIEVAGDRTKIQLPQYQGTVELKNGAAIENAHCAIHTGLHGNASYATAGGIVLADSATFRNNRKAVAFVSYTNHTAGGSVANNVSRFTNCTFTVDDDNLFSQENGIFQDHITMWDVRGVKIKGCAFENAISGSSDRRHAIYAEDAGFVVDRLCGNSGINLVTCTCIDTTIHCSFSGFSTAIEANTTGYQHPVKVEFAVFRNNNTGVRINGNQYATVTRNDFDLQHNPLSFRFNYGLYMTNCTGYKVEENRFHKSSKSFALTSTGIYVNKSGSASNSIYRNTFDTLDRAIHVTDTNGNVSGGLQMTAGDFSNNTYDIYIAQGGLVSPWQGSIRKGADNTFIGPATYNIYNAGPGLITYYHSNSSNYVPNNVTSNVGVSGSAGVNLKITTLCAGEPIPFTSFADKMDEYTGAVNGGGNADGNGHETLADMQQSLSEDYYEAVRELMSDSVLNLNTLEQWHTAAQPIADPYSLTETRFMEGYTEIFAQNAESDAETANYAEFHAMKLALQDNDNSMDAHTGAPLQPDGHINWYSLTPAQIAQLQTIAERNTGRSSVMAKGVLCFFFGICYDDEWDNEGVFDTPLRDDDTTPTRAKRAAMDITDDAVLSVYPNPADNLLYVELRGSAGIANVALYDLQGRVVETMCTSSLRETATATLNMRSVPAGVYLLCVTDADGKEYLRKIVKR